MINLTILVIAFLIGRFSQLTTLTLLDQLNLLTALPPPF